MKRLDDIKTVAITGAGTMGSSIAQICALNGLDVYLFDIDDEALTTAGDTIEKNLDKGIEKGKVTQQQKEEALERLTFTNDLGELVADLIIEAVVERLDVKEEIFTKLAEVNGPDSIFATNTSSIPITRVARNIPNPERVVGMHFFNPAHIMKLVEIISGASTDPEVAKTSKAFAEKIGKVAVMAEDAPGFIVNRVARNFYVEGLKVMEEQIADYATIDELIESYGFKMGPFRLMDLIGVDTNF